MYLSIEESYKAMVDFLEKYYKRTHSDDIGSLLSDMMFCQKGVTMDPAAWQDWIASVNKVKNT